MILEEFVFFSFKFTVSSLFQGIVSLPWEMIWVLRDQPVTRMPSLRMLTLLYQVCYYSVSWEFFLLSVSTMLSHLWTKRVLWASKRALTQWGLKYHFNPKVGCIHEDSPPPSPSTIRKHIKLADAHLQLSMTMQQPTRAYHITAQRQYGAKQPVPFVFFFRVEKYESFYFFVNII